MRDLTKIGVQLSVYVPQDLFVSLTEYTEENCISRSKLINKILREFLDGRK